MSRRNIPRILLLVPAGLFVGAIVTVPRIIEASKFSPAATNSVVRSPVQGRKPEVTVGESIRNDTSPPVREMKQQPVFKPKKEANKNPKIAHPHKDAPDPVVQTSIAADEFTAASMPAADQNFNGIQFPGVACNCLPPDTNGEVGTTQYVQIVNTGFQVFDKTTGASLLGPSGISTVWGGFGGVCEFNGMGDPVVMYDQLADRWVITQFAGVSVATDECVAVSTTGDATGSYHRYDFHLGSNFFDYPHLSVWPDGYYMSMNVLNSSGTSFLGPQPFAFDRDKMLAGLPATFITPGITNGPSERTYLPADLDGSTLPPTGAPATFVQWPGGGGYKIFHFHVDFATPANSSFTVFANPTAAGFTQLCPLTRSCVPQSSTTSRLDALGDRLMFRVAYRNFGTHESVIGNYTVSSGSVAGIRWFELRNVTNGPVTVNQESTYQPDSTWRWLGSAAMDRDGNIALGYSASSATIFPQLRYAGRLATDPLNVLGQGETILFAGTGSQVHESSRWGDYASLTVDPVDDCTFWFTSEYYATTSQFNWRTRIGSFRFPTCGSGNPVGRQNVALAANGGVASSSTNFNISPFNFTAGGANNGVRSGAGWGSGEGWNDAPPGNTFPDWLQIDFNGSKTLDEINVFTEQDNWPNPSEPTEAMTFALYGLTGYEVQYWNGGGWTTIPAGSVTGNNKVWRKFTLAPITTTKIRVLTNASGDGYSRIAEVEAWGTSGSPRTNVARATNGGVASSSTNFNVSPFNFTAGGANNGVRSGAGWGQGEGWNDAPPGNSFPDWLQIDFNGSKTIDEINVFTEQDNWPNPSEPTEAMTFALYGLTGYEVQYWNGGSWTTIPAGSVTGNNKVWRRFTFAPITTTKIRVLTNASGDGYSRITEVEAWSN